MRIRGLYTLLPPTRKRSAHQRTTRYWRVRFRLGKSGGYPVRSSGCETQRGAKDFARLWLRHNQPEIFKLHF